MALNDTGYWIKPWRLLHQLLFAPSSSAGCRDEVFFNLQPLTSGLHGLSLIAFTFELSAHCCFLPFNVRHFMHLSSL